MDVQRPTSRSEPLATSLDVDVEEEHHLGASDGDAEALDADGADLEEVAGEAESEPEPTQGRE